MQGGLSLVGYRHDTHVPKKDNKYLMKYSRYVQADPDTTIQKRVEPKKCKVI